MKEKKIALRKLISQRKTAQNSCTLKRLSEDILQCVEQQYVFQQARTILLYHSLADEVYTHDFIEKWSRQKQVLLPVVIGDELELHIYDDKSMLSTGAYGIQEPEGRLFTNYALIDLAVIPGVAFDAKGNRLGRGKGYYDRLLPQLKAYKVGICFPFQLVDEVPTDTFDIPMDKVITAP